ncbi:hypothetical protein F5Y14DRAFT_409812 [Nemania sp. NC0429]|nr:hypothetical protein F5Y14DRAFT_409812 [Nemania sp. NC0429]
MTAPNGSEDETAVSDGHDPPQNKVPEALSMKGVYGLVYRLHPDDEECLDICEGVGFAYEREMLEVTWAETPNLNLVQDPSSVTSEIELDLESERSTKRDEAQHDEEDRVRISGRKFQALVYVDFDRVTPSTPWEEYVDRMNVGIEEALETWRLPISYVDDVIRPFVPEPCRGGQAEAAGDMQRCE